MVRSECVQDTTRGSPEQDKGIKIQYASPRYCDLSGTPDNVPLAGWWSWEGYPGRTVLIQRTSRAPEQKVVKVRS